MINKKLYKHRFGIVTQNKYAKQKYVIEKEIEAGISLQGWEVSSLRASKVNINNSYVFFKNGEAYLIGANFQPLTIINSYTVYNPNRSRKLLLNKYELNSLLGRVNYKGYSIITLFLYWKNSWIKAKIGLAKGKKENDKRADIKKREWQKDQNRFIKNINR